MALSGTVRGERAETSWPDLLDVQKSCTLCEGLFVSNITGATLSIGERAEVTIGSIVSANYFDAIGVHPILGRGFARGEDSGRNAHPVVVISYRLWQRLLGGDVEPSDEPDLRSDHHHEPGEATGNGAVPWP